MAAIMCDPAKIRGARPDGTAPVPHASCGGLA